MPSAIASWAVLDAGDLFAIAHALAATALTIHALLTKRDVRSAIAWIGMAWLSPMIGVLLYCVFGVNRVRRRASQLSRRGHRRDARSRRARPSDELELPDNVELIARVGSHVTGRPLMRGNAIARFDGGDDAYPAMLAAIGGAQRTIALASYIFRADQAGLPFVAALAEAKSRGVEIRVLIDGVGSGYLRSPARRALAAAGIPVARFLHEWLPWQMPFVNLRNHKKLLIIDGAVGFTGGLNIGAENMLSTRPRHPVKDVHFRIVGPVVGQLMETFAEDWRFTTGESLSGADWWPDPAPQGDVLARGISSGPDEDLGKLELLLQAALGQARRRLRIITPYFLPDDQLMSGLALAALRGVEVDVVLPERTNHILVDWALRAHVGFVTTPGVRFHLAPPPFEHTKLLTVDGHWGLVGSPNWDVRSTRLNFEFSVECYEPGFVAGLDALIDAKIAVSRPLTPADLTHRPLPIRLRDASARLLLPYL
jgi:cardiolipin synthase